MADAPPVRAVLRSRPPSATVWLALDYEGTDPPLELFADLAMVGWRPPAPAPPPASAIAWTADPDGGRTRHDVRPWRVTGAVVEPPAGRGPRGHWTPAERPAFLLALDGVLARHGLVPEGFGNPGTPPLPDPPPTPATSTPASANAAAPADPGDRADPGDPAHPGGPPDAEVGASTVLVAAVVADDPLAERATAALAPLQVPFHLGEVERTVTNTYRGSTFESTVVVLEVQVLVERSVAALVARVLEDCGLHPVVGPPAVGPPGAGPAAPAGSASRRRVAPPAP